MTTSELADVFHFRETIFIHWLLIQQFICIKLKDLEHGQRPLLGLYFDLPANKKDPLKIIISRKIAVFLIGFFLLDKNITENDYQFLQQTMAESEC
ncbi:hypothetical protein [Enterococcus sp. LJL90]